VNKAFQFRCAILCGLLVFPLGLLSGRLLEIQWLDRGRFVDESRRSYLRTETLPAMRGNILDRNDVPLAQSIPATTVYVDMNHLRNDPGRLRALALKEAAMDPHWHSLGEEARNREVQRIAKRLKTEMPKEDVFIAHLDHAADVLARPLGMKRSEIRAKVLDARAEWFPITRNLAEDEADKVREALAAHHIRGFRMERAFRRWYASPNMAPHLVGYTGESEESDGRGGVVVKESGKFGVEGVMDARLRGTDGWQRGHRVHGKLIPGGTEERMSPRPGLDVRLTLDLGLQQIVEEELDWALTEFTSKQGAVVMIDPKTGEVLAMASRPNFDLSDLKTVQEAGASYALQTIYEPGSTIKVVAAAAALNEGLVKPQSKVNCHNGLFQSGKVVVRDDHPAGSLTVEGVIQKSNNIGTYMLGRQVGMKKFYDYMHRFGFGRRTGIQLSGESSGTVRNTGNPLDFSRACYGYAVNVTPLQLACAYSVIAGDGNLRRPIIVREILADDGSIVESFAPEVVHRVISESTAAAMRGALEKVTEEGGTATRATVPGFRVAGKTGTVVKHNPKGGYLNGRYIVSFVGMMPAEDPAFVCIVVVDDPRTTKCRHYGGTIAAPVFSRIAARAAVHLNLRPAAVGPATAQTDSSARR
jgi:cell division protein FtsI/penicillin-binding protein 2